ncbi:MAG: DMT family transporter [Hyphomicrobiales bacterium]|nr:DMT family transporter [Hyphomicrobiales bacterium]
MSPVVVSLVLLAALLHASWNALIKTRGDRLATIALMSASSAALVAPFAFAVTFPQSATWPWLLASALVHIGYRLFLIRAYDGGDLSQVYPLARGAAPLMLAALSPVLIAETLSLLHTVAAVVLAGGIMLLAFERGLRQLWPISSPVKYSAGTACFIAGYTMLDGIGARTNGDALGYVVWLTLIDGLPLAAYVALTRRRATMETLRVNWRAGLITGAFSLVAYGIVIWAMTQAPIALVAALRETSVVLAAVIGALFLGERFGAIRWLAVILVAAGTVLMRL